jgi:hypothetical protein
MLKQGVPAHNHNLKAGNTHESWGNKSRPFCKPNLFTTLLFLLCFTFITFSLLNHTDLDAHSKTDIEYSQFGACKYFSPTYFYGKNQVQSCSSIVERVELYCDRTPRHYHFQNLFNDTVLPSAYNSYRTHRIPYSNASPQKLFYL